MRRSSRLLRLSAVAAALFAASCATPSWKGPEYTDYYRERFPITVAPEMRTLRLAYGGPGAQLDPNMSVQLRAFVREYLDQGTGAISVATPQGLESAALEYAGHIAALGVPRTRILLGTDPMPQRGAEIAVSFIGYVARTEPCGDWSENVAYTLDNAPMLNLGCATQQNIAAMVADPREFVTPQELGPDDLQRRLTVLEAYRAGDPTPAQRTEQQTGAVSDIAGN